MAKPGRTGASFAHHPVATHLQPDAWFDGLRIHLICLHSRQSLYLTRYFYPAIGCRFRLMIWGAMRQDILVWVVIGSLFT